MKIIHGPVHVADGNSAGLSSKSKATKSHVPLPLQSLELVQYVRLDEGKTRYLECPCSRSQFFRCKVLHCYIVFQKVILGTP